ncbi:cyclodehydratase, partial [Streptomyces sp. MBT58]|nr:cyclodehydratase [Streptomyces sp. MBT58]
MTTATAATPLDAPLDAARAGLQAALAARHAATPGGGLPVPYVVPLGAADTLGFGHRDPYADARPAANVQLTARAVLIGPWGGGAGVG